MATADINLSKENKELSKSFPDFSAGDTINVHVKIREGLSLIHISEPTRPY